MRIRSVGRAFVLGTLLAGAASCGSVASNRPDSGGGTGGQAATDDGGAGGIGAGGNGGASATGGSSGAGGADSCGRAVKCLAAAVAFTTLGGGIVVHGGIGPVARVSPPGAVVVVNPRIGGPGPRTCGASACVVRGGIVP